jgi:Mesyanzhinovviridae DNA helicase
MSLAALLEADFRMPCFHHQMEEFESHCDDPLRAWSWSMRTGKTKAAIDKACHLYLKRNKIDGVLIFAPNGVHANWINVELAKHMWESAPYDALVWRSFELSAKRRKHILKADREAFDADRAAWFAKLRTSKHSSKLMVLAINTESMTRPDIRKAVAFFLKNRRVLVIFDESDDWGIPGTKRTKMARALARHCWGVVIMSGTMLVGSPLAAFSQFELLKKSYFGFDKFSQFKDHFADFEMVAGKGGRQYPKLTNFKNLDEMRAKMAPVMSVVNREDVKDMPALIFDPPVLIQPTEEQLRVYRELHHSIMTSIGDEEVSIGELASRLQKLQQVFSGFLIDEFKDLHKIPGENPRLNALVDEVYQCPGKCVVWCQFQEDIDLVCDSLRLEGHKVVEYHGRVSEADKTAALKALATDKETKALVGQMQAGGRGLDMSEAARIFVYSHTFRARARAQAMERATKIGGGNIHVLDFIAPGPDEYILKVTNGRVAMADSLTGSGMKKLLGSLSL